jgi:hypothetical protein
MLEPSRSGAPASTDGDLACGTIEQSRDAFEDVTCCVREQINRVLGAPRAFEGARIHRDAQRLGQFLPVEALALLSELDGLLEQTLIHIVLDQAGTKVAERALRERWLGRAESIEHHLPA